MTKDYQIVLASPSSWDVSEGLQGTPSISARTPWSNGQPVTAQQFVYSWNARARDGCRLHRALPEHRRRWDFFEWRSEQTR